MKILEKLQQLPQKTRKIILWSVIIVLGAGLLIWWINNFQKRLADFQTEQFIEELNLPKVETPQMPAINGELEKLKEILEETETNGQ